MIYKLYKNAIDILKETFEKITEENNHERICVRCQWSHCERSI